MNWRAWFQPGQRRLTPELEQEIRQEFDRASQDDEHFPAAIDPRIYHVTVLLEWFGNLGERAILDVGCGKGRFARVLQKRYPTAEIHGLDISAEMLKCVPAGVETRQGIMTALPYPDQRFDCVYATESLEHAVEIETAVGEMCRVLKPGGKLVIIDKNADHFGRLKTPKWERWFNREELEGLLRRDCREVQSRFISYWEDVPPDGMFLAWLAQK